MKISLIPILILAFMSSINQITLEDLRWKNRVILVFPYLSNSDSQYVPEIDTLQREIRERDLVYFVFQDSLKTNSNSYFSSDYIDQLKKKYTQGIKKDCYILIGKDGGTKLRREQSKIDWEELFGTIDAMPMRIREMKTRENSQ